jgi:uncharacterized surface protein with fasciclin (FAS1) repeats
LEIRYIRFTNGWVTSGFKGTSLSVDGADGVIVSGAKVVSADVEASNRIIHVIDKVFLPE